MFKSLISFILTLANLETGSELRIKLSKQKILLREQDIVQRYRGTRARFFHDLIHKEKADAYLAIQQHQHDAS